MSRADYEYMRDLDTKPRPLWIDIALIVVMVLIIAGCSWVPTRSCTVGVTFFGPIPVPMIGCDITFSPEEPEAKPVLKRGHKVAPIKQEAEEDEDV